MCASERLLPKGLTTMSSKIKKRSGRARERTRPPRKVARRGKQQALGEVSHCDRSQLSDSLSSDDLDWIVQETRIPEELRCFARQSVDILARGWRMGCRIASPPRCLLWPHSLRRSSPGERRRLKRYFRLYSRSLCHRSDASQGHQQNWELVRCAQHGKKPSRCRLSGVK